jgi:hypothetical protein
VHVDLKTSGLRLSDFDRDRFDQATEHLDKLTATWQSRRLHATVERAGHSNDCFVRMVLTLSSRRLISSDKSASPASSFQKCVDVLSRKIALMKERVERNHGMRAVRRAKEEASLLDLDAARRAVDAGHYAGFRDALAEVPEQVEAEIGRRLKFHPDAEALLADEFVIQDLVEEVLHQAFERLGARPDRVTFKDWILGLVDPAIEEVVAAAQTIREAPASPDSTEAA